MKQSGESLEMQNKCAEIKIRAERRAGEILKETELSKGGRPKNRLHDESSLENEPITLAQLGVGDIQSHRWQTLADMPEEEFEKHIAGGNGALKTS